ncbi:hypothetical protein EIP86_004179 [Pleurotus ostreatoroseus]|nr:hypothetical protein EIP86_004179 [Pleurotus ostreatoroseus]
MEAWVARIKLLSEAVNTRIDYVRIEREVLCVKRMVNNPRLAEISDEARERLNQQLADLETQWNQKKDALNTTVFKLIDSDFWPIVSPAADTKSPEERFGVMRATVWELRDKVKELSEMMKQVNERIDSVKSAPAPVAAVSAETAEGGGPPLKRRKVSEPSEEGEVKSTDDSPPAGPPPEPVNATLEPEQLNTINEQFANLEQRISDLENELIQADRNVLEQLEEKLEERISQLNFHEDQSEKQAEAPPDTGQQDAKLAELQTVVNSVSSDIEELAGEVAALISRNGLVENEVKRLTDENAQMRKQIETLEEQHKATGDELKNQRQELNALNAALMSLVSQPPHPPPPPTGDVGVLIESLLPPLLAAVRQDIEPRVGELQSHVEELISAQNEELSATVISKLGNASRAMEVIKNWMDKILQEGNVGGVHIPNSGPLQVSNGVRAISVQPSSMPGKPT